MNYNPFDEITERLVRIEQALSQITKSVPKESRGRHLSTKEAAEVLKISTSHLYRLTMNNEVPFRKVNGRLFFDKDELMQFIDRNGKF